MSIVAVLHAARMRAWRYSGLEASGSAVTEKISAIDAGVAYSAARHRLEVAILEIARRHSSAEWLVFLRAAPRALFESYGLALDPYYTSTLADILSALHPADYDRDAAYGYIHAFPPPFDDTAFEDVIELCGWVQVLRLVQRRIRTAGKEVEFRRVPNEPPVPEPTPSQREAMDFYDSRKRGVPFLGRIGTMPNASEHEGDQVVFVTREFDATSMRFSMADLPAPAMGPFSAVHMSEQNRNTAAGMIIALQLARQMIFGDSSRSATIDLARTGYLYIRKPIFLQQVEQQLESARRTAFRCIPEAALPTDPEALVKALLVPGSAWPITQGPVLRLAGEELLLDLCAATESLLSALTFKRVDGPAGNQRGRHFEEQVQVAIDTTPWSPPRGSHARKLIGQRSLKRVDGRELTNIDAVALRDGVLVIVGCKSIPVDDEVQLGTHSFVRNRAEAIERFAEKAAKVEAYLAANPKPAHGSYDLSGLVRITVIECTPYPIYVEPTMVGMDGGSLSDLQSMREVLPGLRAVTSLPELVDWLHQH